MESVFLPEGYVRDVNFAKKKKKSTICYNLGSFFFFLNCVKIEDKVM